LRKESAKFLPQEIWVPDPTPFPDFFADRQRSEQYLTSSQTRSHFLRQVKGLPQVAQVFCGRLDFFTPRGMVKDPASAAMRAAGAGRCGR
jgi:hypothetical protein